MKTVIVCAVVAILGLALLQGTAAQSHNMEWGSLGNGDRMLFREIVTKSSSFLQIVTKDVSYSGGARITYIKATDQYVNGNGGHATLLKGGVGYGDVTIHLKSQRNHGFNFIIEIYGQ